MEYNEQFDREEIYSKPVRAGKRTYFFDVKSTRGEEFYLTITESKKRFKEDGTFYYEKHKIFLYKEDFDKFSDGFNDALNFINGNGNVQSEKHAEIDVTAQSSEKHAETDVTAQSSDNSSDNDGFSDINFDDLGSDKTE